MTTRRTDIIIWTIFLTLNFLLGVFLFKRDAKEGFGSLAYGGVPYFEFLDTNEKTINLHMLKGKVWLVNFVSENDTGSYPQVYKVMDSIYKKFGNRKNFRLISITSDSSRFNQKMINQEHKNWYFLEGDRSEVDRLMKDNFHLDNTKDRFSSNLKIFLIDQNATIRGHYTISSENDAAHIEKNLIHLL